MVEMLYRIGMVILSQTGSGGLIGSDLAIPLAFGGTVSVSWQRAVIDRQGECP